MLDYRILPLSHLRHNILRHYAKRALTAFNQEKALVGAFSVITNIRMELFEALSHSPTCRQVNFKGVELLTTLSIVCVCRSGCGLLMTTGSTPAAWCARPASSCAAPSSAPRPPPRRARTSTPSTASPAPRSPRTRARISASGSPWPRCAGCECEAAAAPQSIYMQKRNLSQIFIQCSE